MTTTEYHPILSVGTLTLLSAIADTSRERELMPGVPLEVLAAAVSREVLAGNLTTGLNLTAEGRAAIVRLRGGVKSTTTLDVRRLHDCPRHVDGCWLITCTTCATSVNGHIPDSLLVDAIFDACFDHTCPQTASKPEREVHLQPAQMR